MFFFRSFQGVVVEEIDECDDISNYTYGQSQFSNKYSITSRNNKWTKLSLLCDCKKLDFLDSEIWSIIVTLIFQDGPFLALRITAVFNYNVRTFSTLFYTCKNAIILFLQVYRLIAIYNENEGKDIIPDIGTGFVYPETDKSSVRKSLVASTDPKQQSSRVIGSLKCVEDAINPNNNKCCKCECHSKSLSNEKKNETNTENKAK